MNTFINNSSDNMYYIISPETTTVPTKLSSSLSEEKIVSVDYTTQDELDSVKQADKFLYYSIPQVQKREIFRMKEDVEPTKNFKKVSSVKRRRTAAADSRSTSSDEINEEESPTSITIARQSRLSFECHPSLLLENQLLDSDAADDGEDDIYDGEDDILDDGEDDVFDLLDLFLAR